MNVCSKMYIHLVHTHKSKKMKKDQLENNWLYDVVYLHSWIDGWVEFGRRSESHWERKSYLDLPSWAQPGPRHSRGTPQKPSVHTSEMRSSPSVSRLILNTCNCMITIRLLLMHCKWIQLPVLRHYLYNFGCESE